MGLVIKEGLKIKFYYALWIAHLNYNEDAAYSVFV